MKYVRMYTDDTGETHFEDVEVATAPQVFAPPTEPVQVSDPAPAARILFVRIPRGWFGDWHATPKRQFNTTIEGELEITMGTRSPRQWPRLEIRQRDRKRVRNCCTCRSSAP